MIEIVNNQLQLIVDEAVFDERQTEIFKSRYGVGESIKEPRKIGKIYKLSPKKLKGELTKIDNKVFNILKKHDIFE